MSILLRNITKTYSIGQQEVRAAQGISLEVLDGGFVAIMGPSGSGKSTLMNIIGCLDQPSSGSYLLDGVDVCASKDDELALIRNTRIGFVFQSYNLLPRMPAIEQVELPLIYRNDRNREVEATEALAEVGLADRTRHRPTELSGGQSQRVAIARALVTNPSLILADEPTGALDTRTSQEIMGLFQELNKTRGITVIIVTHEPEVAAFTQRTIHLRDGLIKSDEDHEARRSHETHEEVWQQRSPAGA